jgi:hypothetical protein
MTTGWKILKPGEEMCQTCGVRHEENEPHDANSLYWNLHNELRNLPEPTWSDAIAHCDQDTQKHWAHYIWTGYVKAGKMSKEKAGALVRAIALSEPLPPR